MLIILCKIDMSKFHIRGGFAALTIVRAFFMPSRQHSGSSTPCLWRNPKDRPLIETLTTGSGLPSFFSLHVINSINMFNKKKKEVELPIIQQEGALLIDARLLHQNLKIGRDFSNWIKDRISRYGFEEGLDYSPNLASKKSGRGGHNRIDYHLTIDMAKEIAMLEENEIGRKIRKYFIAVEKKLRGISHLPAEPELFKGLKPLHINNRDMFPYQEINGRCGYSKRSSSSRRRATYWMHFVKWGTKLYITKEFALHLFRQKQVTNNRPALKAMNPVIPSDFGNTSQLSLPI